MYTNIWNIIFRIYLKNKKYVVQRFWATKSLAKFKTGATAWAVATDFSGKCKRRGNGKMFDGQRKWQRQGRCFQIPDWGYHLFNLNL